MQGTHVLRIHCTIKPVRPTRWLRGTLVGGRECRLHLVTYRGMVSSITFATSSSFTFGSQMPSYNITCFLLDIPVYWQCLKPWYSHCYDDCLNHSKHKEGGGLCRCRIFPPAIKFLSGFFWRLSRFPGTVGLGGGMLDSTKGRGYRSVYLLKFSTSSSSPHFSQSSSFWAIASLIEPNLSIMLYT